MKVIVKRIMIAFGMICTMRGIFSNGATVSDITVQQRWPWDRKVDINYLLSADPGQAFDVSVTARNGTQVLTLPDESLTGDLFDVEQGQRRIVWDPTVTSYTNEILTQFNVSLTPTNPPLYMIIDLTKAAGAEGQVSYLYEDDLSSGAYGSVETNYIPGVESIIWTGITNDTQYMTSKLVMRRVAAGSFLMSSSIPTTLTKGFYVGVFEFTKGQWYNIMGSSTQGSNYPAENMVYSSIRGTDIGSNWPSSHAVDPTSFIGTLRTKTGFFGFDLPTEAQAEYFTRAGTTSFYYDGVTTGSDTNVLNTLAWWSGNAGGHSNYVGQKLPNAWGLYDTLGNIGEWCLDWWADTASGGVDPVGPASDASDRKVYKSFHYTGVPDCNSRNYYFYTSQSSKLGLRPVICLP